MKLLIAEDLDDVRLLLHSLLTAHGYEVITASDGMEAVYEFGRGNFHAVILDCAMPGMDGFSAAQVMRLIEELKGETGQTKIGFLTAHYRSEELERVMKAVDATRFWEKPIDPNQFLPDLAEWLK